MFVLIKLLFSVAKLRSETKKLAALKFENELLRKHDIMDCYVNLGVRVDAPQHVRSTARPVQFISEISMAEFNREIVLKAW